MIVLTFTIPMRDVKAATFYTVVTIRTTPFTKCDIRHAMADDTTSIFLVNVYFFDYLVCSLSHIIYSLLA